MAITELCKVATGAECADYVNGKKKGPLVSAYNRKEGHRLYDEAVAAGDIPDDTNVYIKAYISCIGKEVHDGCILYHQVMAAGGIPDDTIASIKAYIDCHGKKVHDGCILYHQAIAAGNKPNLSDASIQLYINSFGKKLHDGCTLYHQAIAAGNKPELSNASINAYNNSYAKRIHDATVEACKHRKIELAELERKRTAEAASDQAPAAKRVKRLVMAKCGHCDLPEKRAMTSQHLSNVKTKCVCRALAHEKWNCRELTDEERLSV